MKQITGAGHYGFLIEVTSKKIKQTLQKELMDAGLDLTVDQWVILDYLRKHDGITQNNLGDKIFKDPPTITRIVDLLSRKGLIERRSDLNDRRKFKLQLTAAGRQMIKKASPIVLDVRKHGWKGLSTRDYEELVRILTSVNRNFENNSFFTNGLDQSG